MILENFQLNGQVAIVTGCNTGLGQGMARALAQAGADVGGVNLSEPTGAWQTGEPGYFVFGSKSYGRNGQFLLRDGYEQLNQAFESLTKKAAA